MTKKPQSYWTLKMAADYEQRAFDLNKAGGDRKKIDQLEYLARLFLIRAIRQEAYEKGVAALLR